MSEKSRRDILKYSTSSIVGIPLLTSSTRGAPLNDDGRRRPGQHRLPGSIRIINSGPVQRLVQLEIRRVLSKGNNPSVANLEFNIPGQGAFNDDDPGNILRYNEELQLGVPGLFEVLGKTDDGRTATCKFSNPVGFIRDNERLNVRIVMGSLQINRFKT